MPSLRERIHNLGRLILSQHRSPIRVALAIVLGFVVGCTPTFGVQILICLLLSTVLRLNLPIMYAAANISIPPMIPLIGLVAVQLGEWMVSGHFVALSRTDFAADHLHDTVVHFFWAWLWGGIVLGGLLGLVVGGVVYGWLARRARLGLATPVDALSLVIERAQQRFASAHPRYRYYARYKYRLDPVYRALCETVPADAEVLDLGCGLGMLPIALAEAGKGRLLRAGSTGMRKNFRGSKTPPPTCLTSESSGPDVHHSELPPLG
ncbi:MAG: DUF2062 domain-containing protein [Polyangia bacterium]